LKLIKIILTSLAITLFVSNYSICEYFYPDNIKSWWTLKINIYAIIIALVFLSQSLGTKGVLRFILELGVGISISSVIDKLYFDVHTFTFSDIIMISTTVCFASYQYYRNGRKANK
tara:strand:- start:285 stop:632 length:348 start_codon:yes stop_codon:yes gene_type:complete